MSDQRELARALESMSRGLDTDVQPESAGQTTASPRPATPNDVYPALPGVPSSRPLDVPKATFDPAGTLFPVALALALTMPLLGVGWYLLDPSRVIRSIPGYVPVGMIVAGLACAAAAVMLGRGLTRSARST
jgi:hypothetical protein